ncbi:hypothetical protein OG579_16960 [Williamsia herbipolensis]|uniref:Uncharacterized protein n=1 Tax=Williamsia herbipolensis TaxID=1603258 RepID=A0AAU4K069_9NOCA|nr:hypothetical protein [Williamsia herbipolensis]
MTASTATPIRPGQYRGWDANYRPNMHKDLRTTAVAARSTAAILRNTPTANLRSMHAALAAVEAPAFVATRSAELLADWAAELEARDRAAAWYRAQLAIPEHHNTHHIPTTERLESFVTGCHQCGWTETISGMRESQAARRAHEDAAAERVAAYWSGR